MNKRHSIATLLFALLFWAFTPKDAGAQEHVAPIRYNPVLKGGKAAKRTAKKTTAISLPFFEDFTNYSSYPDSNKWADYEVYINNTMPVSPISRGVATFDDLNQWGLPYDTVSNTDFRYADSLTSQPINLDFSVTVPADSVYLSFFYQPQGNGFYPLPQDSLILYMKNKFGDYKKIWSIPGPPADSPYLSFNQVMIPITDSLFFHGSFQFRFVNIAASYWADAVWNIDYIRLDKNRSISDTAITDVAITTNPNFLLNDYTFMPYSQFMANPTGEITPFVMDSIKNSTPIPQTLNHTTTVTDAASGTVLCTVANTNVYLGYQTQQVAEPLTITTIAYPVYPANAVVTFNTIGYYQSTFATGITTNDTIAKQQVFDNYLAYDDGSAEQAYYLNMNESGAIPAEIEIEFHLNHPDTLRGLAIYFARQVPLADYKEFLIKIYSTIIGVNGYYVDNLLREQDFLFPGYIDTINHFWIYKLDTPVLLPSGTFYAGTVQPAYSGSDSLYFGFDVNRVGGNHAYYRVEGSGTAWNPSLFNGSIMLRPLLGHDITASAVNNIVQNKMQWGITPNPATNNIRIVIEGDAITQYSVTDIAGNSVLAGNAINGSQINTSKLIPGSYFISIMVNGTKIGTKKFIKL